MAVAKVATATYKQKDLDNEVIFTAVTKIAAATYSQKD